MKVKKSWKQINAVDVLSVLLIIFCSNTVVFHQTYGRVTTPLYLLYAFLICISRKKTISKYNFEVVLIFLFMFCFSVVANIRNFSISNDTIIMLMFLVGTIFLVETMTINAFKRYYQYVITIMATYSLLIFILFQAGIITGSAVYIKNSIYVMCMGENMGWVINYHRIAGPYWEGGAYQIFLNVALLFKYDDLYEKSMKKKDLLQLMLFYTVIILTKSTMGCLILTIITIMCLPKVNLGFLSGKSKSIVFGVVTVSIGAALLFSDIVVNKFSSSNLSYITRLNDLSQSISLIKRYPIFGTGYYGDIAKKEMNGNSSGILAIAVFYGLPMLTLYIVQFYRTIKQYNFNYPIFGLLVVFLLMNATECVYTLPIMLIFLLRFEKEDRSNKWEQENMS